MKHELGNWMGNFDRICVIIEDEIEKSVKKSFLLNWNPFHAFLHFNPLKQFKTFKN